MQAPLALGYIIAYFFFFFLPPQGIMTSFNKIILQKTAVSPPPANTRGAKLSAVFRSLLNSTLLLYYKKPPYPLPLPLSGAMGFIGGLLLIMPVMTAPANHTHYSVIRVLDTTLKLILPGLAF